MVYISTRCTTCQGYSLIGFWRCSDGSTLLLCCDECGWIWADPETIDSAHVLELAPPDYKLPDGSCSFRGPKAGWATRTEIEARGWGGFIAGESSDT